MTEQSKMDLNDLKIFVKVVEFKGFVKGAAALQLPKSTVSRAIARLEKLAQSPLIIRTTRQFYLTEHGAKLFEYVRLPLLQLDAVKSALDARLMINEGRIRLTAPLDMGLMILNPVIREFNLLYPQIRFEVVYIDDFMDLIRDGFDLAIRVSRPSNAGYRIRKLGDVRFIVAASKVYLSQAEPLDEIKDLQRHKTLHFSRISKKDIWKFTHKNGTEAQITIRPFVSANHIDSVIDLARRDMGVAIVPEFLMTSFSQDSRLIRVLNDWSTPPSTVYWVTPGHNSPPHIVQLFSKFAFDKIKLRLNT